MLILVICTIDGQTCTHLISLTQYGRFM